MSFYVRDLNFQRFLYLGMGSWNKSLSSTSFSLHILCWLSKQPSKSISKNIIYQLNIKRLKTQKPVLRKHSSMKSRKGLELEACWQNKLPDALLDKLPDAFSNVQFWKTVRKQDASHRVAASWDTMSFKALHYSLASVADESCYIFWWLLS